MAATLRSGPGVGGEPDAGAPVDPTGAQQAHLGDDGDQRLLQAADVVQDVQRGRERHEGIADELAGAVPGDQAAAVDVDDGGAVRRPVRRAGPLARGVHRRVLQQHEHVRAGAVAPGGGVGALRVPGGAVVDEPELLDVQRLDGGAAGSRAVVPHAITLRGIPGLQQISAGDDLDERRVQRHDVEGLAVARLVDPRAGVGDHLYRHPLISPGARTPRYRHAQTRRTEVLNSPYENAQLAHNPPAS